MSLHVDRYDYAGPPGARPLLLIHGWGMHGGMWGGAAQQLARHCCVMAVDLPGHGYSLRRPREPEPVEAGRGEQAVSQATPQRFSLDSVVDRLSQRFAHRLTLCGWSLGGQIALRWARRYPGQVRRLITVASTPCFVARAGWDHALNEALLQGFADELTRDYRLTLRRFLALQVRGGDQERAWLSVLRDGLFSRGEPDVVSLQSGLQILRYTDLRSELREIDQPALVVAGERDKLTPPEASNFLGEQLPNARTVSIQGAAHAPFLSHREEFVRHVLDFMNEE
jgi:pimeloyl-[acyl-carrier protein] methyl ester esterase